MNFGKSDHIESIDFTLPPISEITIKVLEKNGRIKNPKLYCGCGKWESKEWVGKLFPKGVNQKDFLQYYVKDFNCVELNATHYRIFPSSTIRKWRDTAVDGFKFCPKFPQIISRIKRLNGAERETDLFIDSILDFEEKLGPCFLQLPPNFTPKNFKALEAYLKTLPKVLNTCVEFRHKDWFNDASVAQETIAMFIENKVGTVITDTSGRRDVLHAYLTTPIAFIRFVGNDLHPTDFTRMDEWAKRLGSWMDRGLKEAYFFMHQHEEMDSPKLATYFIRKMNSKYKCNLKEPHFVDPKYIV